MLDTAMNQDPLDQSTQTWRPSRGVKFKIIAWAVLVLIGVCLVVTIVAIVSGL